MLSAVLQYHIMCRRRCFWISVSNRALDCDLLAWTHLQHTHFAPALAFIFARKCDGCTPELEMNLPIVLCPSSAVSCCNKFFSCLSITYQSPSAMILRILSSTVMLWNSYTIGVFFDTFRRKRWLWAQLVYIRVQPNNVSGWARAKFSRSTSKHWITLRYY